MKLIEILTLDNGAHRNFTTDMEVPVPEGWAVIPEEMETPDTFPFVNIEVAEIDGVMTVTSMTAGVMPEPEPTPEPETPDNTIEQRVSALEDAIAAGLTMYEEDLG